MADEDRVEPDKEEKKEKIKEEASSSGAEETKDQEKPAEEAKAEETPAKEPKEKLEPPTAEPKKEKPAPTGKHASLIKEIEKMSVADLAELVKALEERFGVSAAPVTVAAPVAPAGVTPGTGVPEAGAAPAGKASYTIHLAASGDQKIAVIKALREIRPDLGLKEAKDLVDGAPKDVAPNIPAEEAQKAKEKLEAVGAKVELR
jgi:large subunit ribosomal protein L7/L12